VCLSLTCVKAARAAGIDSDAQAERALAAEDKPQKGSLDSWDEPRPDQKQDDEAETALTEQELRALEPDLELETTG
jgi:hypothetical protein